MSKIDITVKLGQRTYPLSIERAEEENIRKAAKAVNESLKELQDNYGIKDSADLFAMVALDFSTRFMEKIENTPQDNELVEKIASFERKLEEVLKS
jgi:cell division protein ZapA